MNYQVSIKRKAQKELAQLPHNIALKIATAIRELAQNPRPQGYKKMVGLENTYRVRINDYRVIYSIFDEVLIVHVIKIGHRKSIYKS